MFDIVGKYGTAHVYADQLEPSCVAQVTQMMNHPAFTQPVAIMPDAHAGIGSVVGFTMPLRDKVVPNVVGVDIGCGMLAANFGPKLLFRFGFDELDRQIRARVPFGFAVHDHSTMDTFRWAHATQAWRTFCQACQARLGFLPEAAPYDVAWFERKIAQIKCPPERAWGAVGTLGGGNHFIEIDRDETSGDLWVVIHTGSRKLGESVCKFWQDRAARYDFRTEIARIKEKYPPREIAAQINRLRGERGRIPAAMAWLDLPGDGVEYMRDMLFAQQYAEENRSRILAEIVEVLQAAPIDQFQCVHNFIDPQDMIVRKGAINASAGVRCLVPLNMAQGALLGVGKGNAAWNYSAPHGAGRAMSRSQAKQTLSLDAFKAQMQAAGVWSSSICASTLDEAPGAYKDWQAIFTGVGDTMDVQVHLKPVFNMKDVGGKPSWAKKGA